MIIINGKNHVTTLLELLSAAGEFPYGSLHLLGNARVLRALVLRLCGEHKVRICGKTLPAPIRLISVSGTGGKRTIRLNAQGADILKMMNPRLGMYYSKHFAANRPSGDEAHVSRNHRIAEAVALFRRAGAEWHPAITHSAAGVEQDIYAYQKPTFFHARHMKTNLDGSDKKTSWTRIVGGFLCADGYFAVYNTRNAVMKWSGAGEMKAALMLEYFIRSQCPGIYGECDSAIMLGKRVETAWAVMEGKDGSKLRRQRLDDIYRNIHFIPLNDDGVRLLRILSIPGWHELLRDAVFPRELQLERITSVDCDARHGEKWILSHLDGNLARLLRFHETVEAMDLRAEAVAFPWQASYARAFLGERVRVRTVDIDQIEKNLLALQNHRE